MIGGCAIRIQADTKRLGKKGEDVAVKFLKKRGHKILARNFWTELGEVDIVALEKSSGTICFVEVRSKCAAAADFVEPEASVNRAKQRKIIRAAKVYLKKKRAFGRPVRFDVIAITFPSGPRGKPDIRHIRAAFDASR